MASLHKLSIPITLISSFLLIFSLQSINAQDNDLITRLCARSFNESDCNNYYRSNEQLVAAASTNSTLDFGLAIIKDVLIPRATTTHNYLLEKKQANPEIYGFCEAEWAKLISRFENTLEVTTNNKGYKNGHAFDFRSSAFRVNDCRFNLQNKKVKDAEMDEADNEVYQAISDADGLISGAYK